MKILFIPNWNIRKLDNDDFRIQAPDKQVQGVPYWFFHYFPDNCEIGIIDIGSNNLIRKIEKKIKFYLIQPVKAFLLRNNYDFVISHGAQSGLVYELLASFTSKKPRHLLVDVGGLNGARSNSFEVFLIRFALRKKPVIIIHSSGQISLYNQFYPFLADNVHFIPFGVDYNYFRQFGANNLTGDYALSFGYAKRDYPVLFEGWKLTGTQLPLKIIGVSGTGYPSIRNSNITFINSYPFHKLMQEISCCRFVIIPLPEFNYSYGQMSFLQSMALGKVVIVTETTSSKDYITNAPGVFSVAVNSVQSIAACITRVASLSNEELQSLGKANQEYIEKHFNEKKMARMFYELIQNETFKNTDCK